MLYHLTSDNKNENLTPTPNQPQKVTYKTRCNILAFVFFFTGFIVGSGIIIAGIFIYKSTKEKDLILLIFFFIIWTLIFTCVGGGCLHYYISFNINTYLGIIEVKTIKLLLF